MGERSLALVPHGLQLVGGSGLRRGLRGGKGGEVPMLSVKRIIKKIRFSGRFSNKKTSSEKKSAQWTLDLAEIPPESR